MEENMAMTKEWAAESEELQKSGKGVICAVCGTPIEDRDYSGQKLNPEHKFRLIVSAAAGDAFLPHVLQVHGECLKGFKEKLMEINEGYRWM